MVTVQYSNDNKDDKNEALHTQYIFRTDVPHGGPEFHAAGTGTKMQWCPKVRVVRLWVINREKEDNPQLMKMVLQEKKEGNFWMYVTIVHIEMKNGWSYMGCKRFPKKVEKIGNKFHCKKCDRLDHSPAYRYKLQVRVMDGTGFISLFLWDREAIKLIGKSATQLKGQIDKNAYPVEIDTILDNNAPFNVAVKIHNVEQHVEDSNPDNDLNTPTNTPTKKSLLEVESLGIEVEDDSNAQLSSTKLDKVVKKEKLA
ncbi:hypothetical protein BC332_18829 [Capsicum chinense]|nr:hypothetical protein BC332_18829 [Capsicum chinense]